MRILTYRGTPLWRDARVLRAVTQIVFVFIVVAIVVYFVRNVFEAADQRGLKLGFGFLEEEAGFPIAESVIGYTESDSFRHAFIVGVVNTIKVALIGIVAATVLGLIVGVSRLSSNWLVKSITSVYVEIIRNVPLLVQLFFWYFGIFLLLPVVQESLRLPGPIYVNNRGVFSVWANTTSSFDSWLLFVLGGVVLAVAVRVVLRRIQIETGRNTHPNVAAALALVLLPTLGWFVVGESPLIRETPVLGRFNFVGGARVTPEFAALLTGLVVYTAAFIAEIVRAGIQSVKRGQTEAARALGLSDAQTLQSIVFPQALRVIIPPMISQFLNLTKNSSLAIAIGYPDLYAISRIMINQAGRAVPIMLLIMAAYLAMSLTYAIIGNIYNRRVRFTER
ncbi:MAG: ABC transporter permease subunit [Chloroflexi bacterium]|nr:ABC transporter permease subunit [Chloroflexota bacterium]